MLRMRTLLVCLLVLSGCVESLRKGRFVSRQPLSSASLQAKLQFRGGSTRVRQSTSLISLQSSALEADSRKNRENFLDKIDPHFVENAKLVVATSLVGVVTAITLLVAKHGVSFIYRKFAVKLPYQTLLISSVILAFISFIDESILRPTFPQLSSDYLLHNSNLSHRRFLLRLVGLVATIGSGFSMGIAGPAAELGMVVAHQLARLFHIDDITTLTQCMLAGAGAGVAANFNAPLTGAVFSWEVSRQLVPQNDQNASAARGHRKSNLLLLAAIFSAVLLVRRGHILATPKLLSHSHVSWESLSMHRAEVPLLLPLGLLCGLLFRAYTAFRNFLLGQLQQWRQQLEANGFFFASNLRENTKRRRFSRFLTWWALGPLLAAVSCAYAATHGFTQSLSMGLEVVEALLCPTMTAAHDTSLKYLLPYTLIRFGLVAICSVSRGLIGGQYAPMFFLGAGLGALYHRILSLLTSSYIKYLLLIPLHALPATSAASIMSSTATLPVYVLAGATALLACQFQAAIMASVFALELVQCWNLAPVLFFVSSIAVLFSK